jgi:hypothetical protein
MSADSLGRVFTSYSIEESVDLQDSYLSLQSYTNSRYNGVQLYSSFYNVWTEGDRSYGQSPVIYHNTKKLGLFTEIVKSILPYKSEVKLKYLVNEVGNFTELNQRNRNWCEVQNTFETGDTLNISLLNTQQYSNQYATNGNRLIYESGYSYFPILYYFGSSSLTASQFIPFSNSTSDLGALASNYFETYPSGGKFIPPINYTSASTPVYSGWHEVWDLFDTTGSSGVIPNGSYGTLTIPPSQLGNQFFTGSGPGVIDINGVNVTSSYYIVPFPGAYDFYHNFDINVLGGVGATFTGSMEIWVSSSYDGSFQRKTAVSQSIEMTQGVWNGLLSQQQQWGPNATIQPSSTISNPSDNSFGSTTRTILNGYQLYQFVGAGANCGDTPYQITAINGDTTFKKFDIYETMFFSSTPVYKASVWIDITNNPQYYIDQYWNSTQIIKYIDLIPCNDPQNISLRFTNSFLYDTNENSSYRAGDKVVFRFFIDTTSNGPNQIESGSLRSYIDTVSNPYGISSIYNFINYTAGILQVSPNAQSQLATASICNDQINSAFIIGSQLSGFYSPNYIFNPLASDYSASYAPLYQEYGYVGYPFQLEAYDKILIQVENESGFIFEYNISQVAIDGAGRVNVQIFENLNGYFADGFCNTFYKIVFLKRIPDETNIILSVVKPPGKTSYGFVIPQNIAQDVMDNIDNITRNVKLQLLDAGSNVIV